LNDNIRISVINKEEKSPLIQLDIITMRIPQEVMHMQKEILRVILSVIEAVLKTLDVKE